MHQIENEFLKVKVRTYGAELTSVFDKKNKIEHLWQADENFWPWHAPVLFPVVGRCLNDEIMVDGVKYPMEKHGFARKSDFKVLEHSESKLVFMLGHSEETLRLYPYQFEFLIAYKLSGSQLQVQYEVRNVDAKPIYFQLGGHPAFAVPFTGGEQYEDYSVVFEQAETANRHFIDADGFFDGRIELTLNNTDILPLKPDMFKDDALIFKDLKSRSVSLRNKNNERFLTVDFKGFEYLGLWAKVNAPYVCIEPWLGCADTAGDMREFRDKEGIIKLLQEERFNVSFTVKAG